MTYREKSPCSILSQMGHREKRERERLCTEVWHLAPWVLVPGPAGPDTPIIHLFPRFLSSGGSSCVDKKQGGGLYNKSDKSRFKSGK